MRNLSEVKTRLKDAQASLSTAQRSFPVEDHRAVIQNAQLCIELSAKAVIAYYEEPAWTHDPSEELLKILEERGEEIAEMLGNEVESLYTLAEDAGVAAPWHARSTYGARSKDGVWLPAVDVCTKEMAEDLLERASRSYKTAVRFSRHLGLDR